MQSTKSPLQPTRFKGHVPWALVLLDNLVQINHSSSPGCYVTYTKRLLYLFNHFLPLFILYISRSCKKLQYGQLLMAFHLRGEMRGVKDPPRQTCFLCRGTQSPTIDGP